MDVNNQILTSLLLQDIFLYTLRYFIQSLLPECNYMELDDQLQQSLLKRSNDHKQLLKIIFKDASLK